MTTENRRIVNGDDNDIVNTPFFLVELVLNERCDRSSSMSCCCSPAETDSGATDVCCGVTPLLASETVRLTADAAWGAASRPHCHSSGSSRTVKKYVKSRYLKTRRVQSPTR